MNEFQKVVNEELFSKLGSSNYRMPKLFENPINIGMQLDLMKKKNNAIKEFLSIVAKISRESLQNGDFELIKLLFSESPAGMTVEYHRNLPDFCWNIPIVYRTDQSLSGKIYEIQSPGSGWGDIYLYANCLKKMGNNIPNEFINFPENYAENIINATNIHQPKVFHMLDAASVPYSMKYLLEITKNRIDYWGISNNVSMDKINCLISHSVISIVTSNFFDIYLSKAKDHEMIFAVQPNIIFDEKVIYLLPFYRKTKKYFSNKIRSLFPFTTLVEENGFYLENDLFLTINEFSKLPPSQRKYYLKYAGPNTSKNWGSRSVYRLSGDDCNRLLLMASELTKKGEVWIIQKDVSKELPMDVTDDIMDILTNQKLNIKLSAYYGKNKFLGDKIMARKHFKVHGQFDTYVGIGI